MAPVLQFYSMFYILGCLQNHSTYQKTYINHNPLQKRYTKCPFRSVKGAYNSRSPTQIDFSCERTTGPPIIRQVSRLAGCDSVINKQLRTDWRASCNFPIYMGDARVMIMLWYTRDPLGALSAPRRCPLGAAPPTPRLGILIDFDLQIDSALSQRLDGVTIQTKCSFVG